ncbi:MAG: N-6 DNA methylase [Chitinophagaceae bacterium]|nr:N-6 DNA methylase [Chitinophagaceae bacterium]
MALFQKSVLRKFLNDLDKTQLQQAWQLFKNHFHNPEVQRHIWDSKEEEYQEGFVRDLFVNILGYTLKPQPNYNLVLEKKTEADATKSDGALLRSETVIGVIELKDTDTTELDSIEKQVFGYKHKHKNCVYVITANFEKLRFYINDSIEYEEFDLFNLTENGFALLYLCLQQKNIENDITLRIKQASVAEEENVTKKLYAGYSDFKHKLLNNLVTQNPHYNKLELFKKTQKLLDRFLFILFAEDRLLVPPNSVRVILADWEKLQELDHYVPLYDRFKKYFCYLNKGHAGKQYDIYAYNGGLFADDEILDNIKVDDKLLYDGTKALSNYDFQSEVDVNILGHIFEHSLSEIEEVQAELEGKTVEKTKTKRKKDGVFYTPRYITKYIVENTVGELCRQKKEELEITSQEFAYRKRKDARENKLKKLDSYRKWLLELTICDPACGSGAFLNQALEFLIAEHRLIDELRAKLLGEKMVMNDMETEILSNNLFGVDINEEAVEIARLSLWLRTAQKGRKLSDLSRNIKCGNSLIDDPAVAGDKAFNWQKEFPQIFGPQEKNAPKKQPEQFIQKGKMIETSQEIYQPDTGDELENSPVRRERKFLNIDTRITNTDDNIVNEPLEPFRKQNHRGFDVVIGNPPYVDIKALPKEIIDYVFKNFESSNNRINLFAVFIERSLFILKRGGHFSFIIPSSLLTQESYKNLREILLSSTKIKSIVRLPNESFGGSAGEVKVDTIILTFENSSEKNRNIEILIYKGFERINEILAHNTDQYYKLNQDDWAIDEHKIFRINVNSEIGEIISKIESNTDKLINCADFCLGLTPYDKYKGHTPDQIEKRVFHSANKKDDTFKKLLAGNDVRRYFVQWGGDEWISYGDWLGAPREQRFFKEKRILVKQIIDWSDKRIWAALTEEELYNAQNAFNLIPKNNFKPEYLIAVINSNLMSFYLRKKFLEEFKDRFQKILIKDCKEFPVVKVADEVQLRFVEKVNIMLSRTKELHEAKKQLLQLLTSKYDGFSSSKKLEDWPSLSFKYFLKELTKQKVKLSLAEQTEWMQHFETEKAKANAIQQIIDSIDKEIDLMVYELYGLTEEEIKIVEGN